MNYFVNHKLSSDYFRKDYNPTCTGIRTFKNKNLKKNHTNKKSSRCARLEDYMF